MLADKKFEELARLVAGTCFLTGVEVVVERVLLVGVGAESLEIVLYGFVPTLHADIFLGNVGVDAANLPSVFGGAEVVLDGFLVLAHLAIDHAERIEDIGVGGILFLKNLEKSQGPVVLLVEDIPVGAPNLHLDAVGVETLGEVEGRDEWLLVVDLEVVIDNHLELVDVVELHLATHHCALEVEHQLLHFVVEIGKTVIVHSVFIC